MLTNFAAALRLFRKVVGLKDDFYNRYLIKGDLFKPLIESFLRNGTKYNLLNSAMIELFEFMRSVGHCLKLLMHSNPLLCGVGLQSSKHVGHVYGRG